MAISNIYMDDREKKRVTFHTYFDPNCFNEISSHLFTEINKKKFDIKMQKQIDLHYEKEFTKMDIDNFDSDINNSIYDDNTRLIN